MYPNTLSMSTVQARRQPALVYSCSMCGFNTGPMYDEPSQHDPCMRLLIHARMGTGKNKIHVATCAAERSGARKDAGRKHVHAERVLAFLRATFPRNGKFGVCTRPL